MLCDGECGIIEAAREIYYDEPENTYNFEVEDFHTYYVGESNVLVHNKCRSHELGKQGEDYIAETRGLKKNNDVIDGRIPDFLEKDVLIESKNVSYQSMTKQLRTFSNYADLQGIPMELYVRQSTKLSSTVLESGMIIRHFRW